MAVPRMFPEATAVPVSTEGNTTLTPAAKAAATAARTDSA
jgi:hypothetical protein